MALPIGISCAECSTTPSDSASAINHYTVAAPQPFRVTKFSVSAVPQVQ
jgi:hypothetical protein